MIKLEMAKPFWDYERSLCKIWDYKILRKSELPAGKGEDEEEGFYLIDLSELPISYMTTRLKDQLPTLADKVQKLADEDTKIILIISDVYEIAFRFLKDRFKNVIDVKIPFPSNGHQNDFKLTFF